MEDGTVTVTITTIIITDITIVIDGGNSSLFCRESGPQVRAFSAS
jgi:hypothetical protein